MSLCIVFCINGFAASPLEPRSRHNPKASLSLGTSLIALIAMVPPSLAFIQTYLQEAWPTVESALAEYGIICKLDLGQYSVRLGRLMHYLHVGYSEYDYQKEMIVVIGSPLRLQAIRKIMVDAIVHDVDPSPRVNPILTSSQVMMDLKDLHL
ncbi:unnamed protein product [Prunus armeniaca]